MSEELLKEELTEQEQNEVRDLNEQFVEFSHTKGFKAKVKLVIEKFKKIIKKIIYPHLVIFLSLVPISFSLLIYSLIYLGTNSIISYISYLLSFYSLLVFCFRIPNMINYFKKVKDENKYLQRLFNDVPT